MKNENFQDFQVKRKKEGKKKVFNVFSFAIAAVLNAPTLTHVTL